MKPDQLAGTSLLALLALVTVVASVAAGPQAPAQYPMACRVRAYSEEAGGLQIRSGPGQKHGLLKQLARQTTSPLLMIRAGLGNWMKVTDVQSMEGQLLFPGPGWVYGPQLTTSVRAGLEGDEVPLYQQPDTRTPTQAMVKAMTSVRILYCQGAWVKVRAGKTEGWLAPELQCGNPAGCVGSSR